MRDRWNRGFPLSNNTTADQQTVVQFGTFFFILMVIGAGVAFFIAGFRNQSGMK